MEWWLDKSELHFFYLLAMTLCNDTLINTLKQYYLRESIKFQGDIACLAHVLNLVVQILRY